jgi:peptide-methionine (S)-S-oxide reductase
MFRFIFIFTFFSTSLLYACNGNPIKHSTDQMSEQNNPVLPDSLEIATLGAGCFWCVEAIFDDLIGVQKVVSGYSGGTIDNPTYKQVCEGTTGHAEVCQIFFDPKVISFEEILEVFWTTHDPTTLNRQGNDVGTQYRSAVFYHSEAQKNIAEKSKNEIAPKIWDNPIVTEITAYSNFFPAEDYHQDYFELNPNQGYCRAVIAPKVSKFRQKFKHKLKSAQ